MRRSKFTAEEISAILQEAKNQPLDEVCESYSISLGTFYKWRSRYGNYNDERLQRLKELEEHNKKLERLYAQAVKEKLILQQAVMGKLERYLHEGC